MLRKCWKGAGRERWVPLERMEEEVRNGAQEGD
jgi:hypothetical protein